MFNSKLCVVTGGGSGIGKALCEQLVKAGAGGVYVVDINRESAQKVAASLPSLAIHHHQNNNNNFRCNFGAADVGIMTMGGIDVDDVSNGQWEKIWNVNVMSHVFAARHLFPLWRHKKRRSSLGSNLADDRGHLSSSEGIFVITASAAGLLMQTGSLPYHVTKHAAVSVADWLAVHHYGDGVRVHCICPQAVQTNMLASSVAPGGGSAGLDGILLPNEVAIETIQAIERKQFLVLPHPKVKKYFERKASDYDRWLNGMRRVHRHFFSPSKI
eukprot:scaffold2603_cov138-Skeletonema_menzelii.AAC.3